MLGIFFGVICTIALVKVARGRGHWGRHRAYGRRGRHFILRRLFRRLDTGPGQEKVVLTQLDELRETAHSLKVELKGTRSDVAAMLRDAQFDRGKLEALYRKQDELLAKLRTAAASAIENVHAVLDERQKGELADLLERGFRSFAYGRGTF